MFAAMKNTCPDIDPPVAPELKLSSRALFVSGRAWRHALGRLCADPALRERDGRNHPPIVETTKLE